MKIHVSINDEDYITYNIYHYFHSSSTKTNVLIGRLMPLLFSILAIAVFILIDVVPMLLYAEIAFLTLYSIIGFFRFPKSVEKNIRKNILKLKKEGKLPYAEEASLDFGDNEITETSPNNVKRIPYSSILAVQEIENYIYLIIGAVEAVIIPIRCLDNKDTLLEFLNQKNLNVAH